MPNKVRMIFEKLIYPAVLFISPHYVKEVVTLFIYYLTYDSPSRLFELYITNRML